MIERWYVGFCDGADVAWYQRLLRPGYRHCWVAREIAPGLWMWSEWTPERMVFTLCTPAHVDRCALAAHEVLIHTDKFQDATVKLPFLALHHCAAISSYLVGLRPRPWVTPWLLRCALVKRGALPFMSPSGFAGGQEPAR